MKYHIQYSGRFKKSLKKAYKRGLDVEVLRGIISSLENSGVVDAKYLRINFRDDIQVVGSAMFSLIGYSCGSRMMIS